ncbi:MAG TPA: sigma-54 dependent transcriptional regulator [Fimbriimonadaceae bacterium]|mgnify:CR=1 FL=1|nr:sigma-54 dependent transcriptional regulator [Fimbriimonadaceae bacterium]HRJ33821.1 sigma-54 dependent transcriptional regulator [Fimbriimonadaceae bacterium]
MKTTPSLLIVDDELNIRRILQAAFEKVGYQVHTAENGVEAVRILEARSIDCVVTDVTMPLMNGYQLQNEAARIAPETPVILMTAYGTIPQAIQAIRNGAFEFVTKPFDLDHLKKIVARAIEQGNEPRLQIKQGGKSKKGSSNSSLIFRSQVMQDVYSTVEQVADSRATVLITGESGTGKEVIARLLHELSPRKQKNFVAVSCAALPESLLESELFGYEKGAFTGAQGSKAGRFEMAHDGTLFLDEIGEIPHSIQVKLLRVLQEREIERLGSTKTTKIDVRLVTATNRNLQEAVDAGIFRLDLMYRLQVVEIQLPPLRARQDDIEPLAEHFLGRLSQENGRNLQHVSPEALNLLRAYSWPGNVRELENTLERAVVLSNKDEAELLPRHLPPLLKRAA